VSPELHRSAAARLAEQDQQYTRNRRALVAALAEAGAPLTLPELLEHDTSLAQSSAYRNLSVLIDAGVVRRLVHGGDHARYELDERLTEHHHHLICETCGTVVDVTLPARLESSLDQAFDDVAAASGFAPSHHAIDVYGTCSECRP
jgi:Fur family transcriptional regulator, ferric uptake regulator